ncbi:hypothetical protein M422DRAFT_24164 [Sphaerobolus stellatus SS14]|nr:hypothetical protein M422DRAFT_24164 [Sphaerobolus stellatus SS14]
MESPQQKRRKLAPAANPTIDLTNTDEEHGNVENTLQDSYEVLLQRYRRVSELQRLKQKGLQRMLMEQKNTQAENDMLLDCLLDRLAAEPRLTHSFALTSGWKAVPLASELPITRAYQVPTENATPVGPSRADKRGTNNLVIPQSTTHKFAVQPTVPKPVPKHAGRKSKGTTSKSKAEASQVAPPPTAQSKPGPSKRASKSKDRSRPSTPESSLIQVRQSIYKSSQPQTVAPNSPPSAQLFVHRICPSGSPKNPYPELPFASASGNEPPVSSHLPRPDLFVPPPQWPPRPRYPQENHGEYGQIDLSIKSDSSPPRPKPENWDE